MSISRRTCAPEEDMHTTNSLLAITVLAAASAQAQAHEPPDLFNMQLIAHQSQLEADAEARQVIAFWKDAGPALWFAKDDDFDRLFRSKFLGTHEAAARGELAHWQSTPEGAFALLILLDQFPRNAFRGTPRMYATDASARKAANLALAAGYDRAFPVEMRKYFILPFAHSEDMADQERSVALARRTGSDDLMHAEHHRDIIKRFGRFPHRNAILGRETTAEERAYLDNGGYQG
jgi:uncharacterized protein (DUF924 family)